MSMMPLLSASRSLVSSRDLGKQFRMSDPKAMPNFGGKSAQKFQTSNSKLHPPSSKHYGETRRSSESQAQKIQAQGAGRKKDPGLIATCFAKLKTTFASGQRVKSAAIPRFSGGPIQCELSLDNVKVLRNDLSDTDFEVIAKPVQPEEPAVSATAAAPSRPNREKIWDRVTTLLGAGQT